MNNLNVTKSLINLKYKMIIIPKIRGENSFSPLMTLRLYIFMLFRL